MNDVNRIDFSLNQFNPKTTTGFAQATDKKPAASNAVSVMGALEEQSEFNLKLSDKDKEKLVKEIDKLNSTIKESGTKMHFKYIEEADKFVVELVDLNSQEVIESLPPEYMIDLSIKIREMIGLFVDKKV